jgi:plasmid stabilization system protein ParE
MGYDVQASEEFAARLDEAVAYRADNYGLRSARRLVDSVDATQELLAGSPLIGALVDSDAQTAETCPLRWVRVDSYIAVYRADPDARTVVLLTLFHATSNWRKRVLG